MDKKQRLMELHTNLGVDALNRAIRSVGLVIDYGLDNAPEGAQAQLNDALRDIVKARHKMKVVLEHNNWSEREPKEKP